MMSCQAFLELAKKNIVKVIEETQDVRLMVEDIVIVNFFKTLKNFKGTFTDIIKNRKQIYEVTYNGDTSEFYIDVYTKMSNVVK